MVRALNVPFQFPTEKSLKKFHFHRSRFREPQTGRKIHPFATCVKSGRRGGTCQASAVNKTVHRTYDAGSVI
jgi:hypothetical protein